MQIQMHLHSNPIPYYNHHQSIIYLNFMQWWSSSPTTRTSHAYYLNFYAFSAAVDMNMIVGGGGITVMIFCCLSVILRSFSHTAQINTHKWKERCCSWLWSNLYFLWETGDGDGSGRCYGNGRSQGEMKEIENDVGIIFVFLIWNVVVRNICIWNLEDMIFLC